MATKGEKETASTSLLPKILYGLTFTLIFCIAVSVLGIDSHILHKYGNGYATYPTKQFKHDIGLILFNCIFTFLWLLAHPFISMGISIFLTFLNAVFWGTSAGILFNQLPFKSSTCGHPVSSFPTSWQPYAASGECAELVTLHGLCWAQWGLMIFLLFGSIYHKFQFAVKPAVSYYGTANAV